jgi:hypothetical protein
MVRNNDALKEKKLAARTTVEEVVELRVCISDN